MNEKDIDFVMKAYDATLSHLDWALVGQKNVKKVVAASLLCSSNSRILLTGGTGFGKSTLSDYLASSFEAERIQVTSDLLPSDILQQLRGKKNLRFLQVEELNRASGKTQSAFIDLFSKNQIKIGEKIHKLDSDDFYVMATQNNEEISGIFNVPQAVYDRFDVSIAYDDLTDDELRKLLFGESMLLQKRNLQVGYMSGTQRIISNFIISREDEDMLIKIFNLIKAMPMNGQKLFAGSNVRGHQFAIKLVKLMALSKGRDYLLPTDILDFVEPLYMHRIDQNVAQIGDENVKELFDDVKIKIKKMKRPRY